MGSYAREWALHLPWCECLDYLANGINRSLSLDVLIRVMVIISRIIVDRRGLMNAFNS